jgi:integrase
LSIRPRNGGYELRWLEGGKRRSKMFDRKGDADKFDLDRRRRKQLGRAAVVEDILLNDFVGTYWRLHAVPNLAPDTREHHKRLWAKHAQPRIGQYGVREINSTKRLARFRDELERAGVGTATILKTMAMVQSMLTFAVGEEIIEYNAGRTVPKPTYERERQPHIFLPPDVEEIRRKLDDLRDRTLVSVLAYAGPRPEEALRLSWEDVGHEAIKFMDTSAVVGIASGGRRFSSRLRKIYASGSSPAGALMARRPCSQPMTGTIGVLMTGATGATACGRRGQR